MELFDEPPALTLDETAIEPIEAEIVEDLDDVDIAAPDAAERDADDEDRSSRRRGRRRRRGGRRPPRPDAEQETSDAPADDMEDDDEEQRVSPRSEVAEVRERRVSIESEEENDLEDETDDRFEDDEDEDADEATNSERLRLKHKKIPTWQQAIDAILTANMQSRAKNPGSGGNRGRGRRWRK